MTSGTRSRIKSKESLMKELHRKCSKAISKYGKAVKEINKILRKGTASETDSLQDLSKIAEEQLSLSQELINQMEWHQNKTGGQNENQSERLKT
jgi:heterodisulfide reductase subunit C